MDEDKVVSIAEHARDARGKAIIDGKQDYREDSYTNMLTKIGTSQDSSTAYRFSQEPITPDLELIRLYEGNGLFTKIIDRPAEEAVKHGLDIDYGDEDITEYVEERLDELNFEDAFTTAEKWARLYGGSIIVMLVDDGGALEDPLDWKRVRRIAELRVFERAIVQADYTGLYNFNLEDSTRGDRPYGQPEYYNVFSVYGSFTVHYTRCLVFRNGRVPEQTTNSIYRYWGIPEYEKIKKALRECITSHEDGVRLLERSVQAIYKMRNLSNLLATDEGEDKILQRLLGIDTSRSIINTMAIDADGEDYDFKTLPMSGVKDITDMTCNMLSAVTGIPQTVLFGRSPAGENSTGQSDFENYYNMVENIQKQNMKRNVRTLINLILIQGQLEGRIDKVPEYKVKFAPLWSLTEQEQIAVDLQKAQIQQTKATVAQSYVEMQVLDPTEIRNILAKEGDFDIEEVANPDDDLDLPEDALGMEGTEPGTPQLPTEASQSAATPADGQTPDRTEQLAQEALEAATGTSTETTVDALAEQALEAARQERAQTDSVDSVSPMGDIHKGVGVLVIKDGYILCGQRADTGEYAGPGGHMKAGETAEQAAIRETREEFGITPLNLIPIGDYIADSDEYDDAVQFIATDYDGEVFPGDHEMFNLNWMTMQELADKPLFEPFKTSLEGLINLLLNGAEDGNVNEDAEDENWIEVNGTPVLLDDNGNAKSGPLKGMSFAKAKSKGDDKPKTKKGDHNQKTSPKDKITHFKTEDGKMHITEDTDVRISKSGKTTVTIKAGQDIDGIYSFAGKGSDEIFVNAGNFQKKYPGTNAKDWAHKCGYSTVIDADGEEHNAEIHWFEHDDVGQTDFKVKNVPVRYSDVPDSTKQDIKSLLDRHTMGHDAQKDADYEIAHHIASNDTIGKAIIGKSADEEKAWEAYCKKEKENHQKEYERQIDDIKEAIKPGGYLQNYTEEQLKDMGLYPEKTEYREPRFYRKGDIGSATMSFTTSESGANMHAATDPDGSIGWDHSYTMKELKAMGYIPIAGIAHFDVGYVGESEVMFASKYPTKKQLSEMTHGDVTVNSPGKAGALKEKRQIDNKYEKAMGDISEKMAKLDPNLPDYITKIKELSAQSNALQSNMTRELTDIGKKYGVTLGENKVPYDVANDPKFDKGGKKK